ncbi:MAG: 1-deoxy-D-xylulose-5-phosphate synthase [Clostridia bacterium]|nr:1-deoxy-D-xylulose-5-phosphate synthase [Clostridia bacterium]
MLEKIASSADLKGLGADQLKDLCAEIRRELIRTVSANGGHLASNLGIVELTVALHRVYNTPEDKIIFDVGHQSYVHKLITGRYNQFSTLREYGGISGFPKRSESEYDCYETGHASTAISAALGMARARDYRGEKHQVIAVVGDGALTGGMCYEALNDAGNSHTQITVILNDNEMSIAPNVGALSSYLTNLRISAGWQSAKKKVRHLSQIPMIGKPLYGIIHKIKKFMKYVLVRDKDLGFFEALGFQYFGPIDGHDVGSLEKTFRQAQLYNVPCVIHVLTRKGYGYEQAEKRPEAFHGTPPFYVENGNRMEEPNCPSSGHRMADTLSKMAETDHRIVAITAAMPLGTGLDHFAEKHPDRMIDVGIAEEHAASLAAGLAVGGMRPYFAVYASFFQRCYDQMIHDICMQKLPVVFLLDRSGIGGEDGQTHHGVFDFAETLPVPGMTVLAPCDADELCEMIEWTAKQDGPVTIRYAKNGSRLKGSFRNGVRFTPGQWPRILDGEDAVLLATGSMVRIAASVHEMLQEEDIHVCVYNCSTVKPLDGDVLCREMGKRPVFTLEEHMMTGGFGEYVTEWCRKTGITAPTACIGIGDIFLQHGSHDLLMKDAGLDADQIAERIRNIIRRTVD